MSSETPTREVVSVTVDGRRFVPESQLLAALALLDEAIAEAARGRCGSDYPSVVADGERRVAALRARAVAIRGPDE